MWNFNFDIHTSDELTFLKQELDTVLLFARLSQTAADFFKVQSHSVAIQLSLTDNKLNLEWMTAFKKVTNIHD
jgi:hypothetical protein